jgi:hypothetical protein
MVVSVGAVIAVVLLAVLATGPLEAADVLLNVPLNSQKIERLENVGIRAVLIVVVIVAAALVIVSVAVVAAVVATVVVAVLHL